MGHINALNGNSGLALNKAVDYGRTVMLLVSGFRFLVAGVVRPNLDPDN